MNDNRPKSRQEELCPFDTEKAKAEVLEAVIEFFDRFGGDDLDLFMVRMYTVYSCSEVFSVANQDIKETAAVFFESLFTLIKKSQRPLIDAKIIESKNTLNL